MKSTSNLKSSLSALCHLLSAIVFTLASFSLQPSALSSTTNRIATITVTNAANISGTNAARLILTNADLSIDTRTWTNSAINPSTNILAGTNIAQDAQYLLVHVAAHPFTNLRLDGDALTYIRLQSTSNFNLTIISNWASVTWSTQLFGSSSEVISVPLDNGPHAVSVASQLEENMTRLSTNRYTKVLAGTNTYVQQTSTGAVVNTAASVDTSGHVSFAGGVNFNQGLGLHGFLLTTNYTITTNDLYIGVDTSTGAVTLTLPLATPSTNYQWSIKDETGAASSNFITIATQNADKIDGTNQYLLTNAFQSISILSRGRSNFVAFVGLLASATTTPSGFDNVGPLDQAIYSSGMDKIYAVRGQYVYRFAADGSYETNSRYADGIIDSASLTELGAYLYVGVTHGIIESAFSGGEDQHARDVYKLNRTNLTATALGLWSSYFGAWNNANGWDTLFTDGTYLYGRVAGASLFRCSSTGTGFISDSGFGSSVPLWDVALDVNNNAFWAAHQRSSPEVDLYALDYHTSFNSSYSSSGTLRGPIGLALHTQTTNIYYVTGTTNLGKAFGHPAYHGFIDIGLTNAPLTGNTFTLTISGNSTNATWTNTAVASRLFILTNATLAGAAANLNSWIGTNSPTGTASHSLYDTAAVEVNCSPNYIVSAAVSPSYATVTNASYFNNFAVTNLAITNAALATMNPVRIKYRAQTQKLYIPTWSNDRVIVFDPATDTVDHILTGFTAPFDIVFTDTGGATNHAYAVQQSAVGLKLIE